LWRTVEVSSLSLFASHSLFVVHYASHVRLLIV
jgi:hypothetical protein